MPFVGIGTNADSNFVMADGVNMYIWNLIGGAMLLQKTRSQKDFFPNSEEERACMASGAH